jgi:peptide/nickel transport system substrate-binding protein
MLGGQFDVEFRGRTPSERDQFLKSADKDNWVVHEGPWVTVDIVIFNTTHKPFDDPRVRRALSLAIDRWGGNEALSKITFVKATGGFLRPGYEYALPEAEILKIPGYDRDIEKSRTEARRLLKEAGVEHLKIRLTNRTIANLFTGGGVYVIDQWRQIGVETEHFQANDVLYNNALNEGTFDVALSFQGDSVDEPTYQLTRYLSVDLSSNQGKYIDRELDHLFELQKDATDPQERRRFLREFEMRMMTEAYNVPLLWWQRIVVMSTKVKGWEMSPSHLIGQDLEKVWLEP